MLRELKVPAMIAFVVIVAMLALASVGCSARYWTGVDTPRTKLRLNPRKYQLELENTKDVDVEASDVTLKHDGTELKLGHLKLSDTASGVRRANVDQINAVANAQMTQVAYLQQAGANLDAALKRLDQLAGTVAPGGIAGVGRGQVGTFWYFLLAAGCVFGGVWLWQRGRWNTE